MRAPRSKQIRCYANNAYNPAGGTHLTGFRNALTRTLSNYAKKNDLLKNDIKLEGPDFSEGLTAVVSVQLPNPHFESQTKVRLNNPEVDGAVQTVVGEYLPSTWRSTRRRRRRSSTRCSSPPRPASPLARPRSY